MLFDYILSNVFPVYFNKFEIAVTLLFLLIYFVMIIKSLNIYNHQEKTLNFLCFFEKTM